MRKITTLILGLACVSVFSLSSCGATTTYGVPAKLLKSFSATDLKTEEFERISNSVIEFGSEFSGAALNDSSVKDTDNIALSPISLYMALAMSSVCADGSTRGELLSALNDISYEELVTEFPTLYNALNFEPFYDTKGKLLLTNSVWIDKSFPVKDECIDLLSDKMYAYSFGADFSTHNEATNKRITNFVKKETNGLIDNDFQVREDTVFALINTLYLKTTWLYQGELSPVGKSEGVDYASHPFKKGNGTTSTPSYYTTGYNYGNIYTGDTFSCFYGTAQNGIHITFITPNEGYSLRDINNSEVFNEVMSLTSYPNDDPDEMISYYTRAIFPLFNASYNKDVKELLKETFNLETLFDSSTCDFSSITDDTKGLYVSQIQHVNELKLTTEGIEGSSATVHTTGRATAADSVSEYTKVYQDFPVDKAFTYIISFNNIPLFTGVVNTVN